MIPIQWLTLKGDYNWSKGATGFQALSYGKAYAPSFYVEDSDLKYTKANSVQVEATITPIPQFAAWGGYAQTKVKNAEDVVESKKEFAKKATGWFIGAGYKLTKVTRVQLEYDRFNTTWQKEQETNKYKGDQYALIFIYNF
jgi:predicted porin